MLENNFPFHFLSRNFIFLFWIGEPNDPKWFTTPLTHFRQIKQTDVKLSCAQHTSLQPKHTVSIRFKERDEPEAIEGLLQASIAGETDLNLLEGKKLKLDFDQKTSLPMEEESRCCFSTIMASNVGGILVSVMIALVVIRILYVIHRSSKPLRTRSSKPVSTLIVLGSGGHTAEMLNLLSVLKMDRYTPRFYIAAATDNMSLQKARAFENSLFEKTGVKVVDTAQCMQIYRSREVGQSYITSIWTTLVAIAHALLLMIKIRPQVILCNGPGTCIPLCVIAFFFKVVGIRWSSIFYIESIARVKRLSLSGMLLYKLRIADQFFVQWPQLQRKYPRSHYVGCLM